jgi:arabinofuranosyltransferase
VAVDRVTRDSTTPTERTLVILAGITLAGSVLLNAWVCDDAYVTMRTVEAFLRGDGLVWNPGERVQASTHPLWLALLVLARAVGVSAYAALLGAGLLCTALLVLVMTRIHDPRRVWPVLMVLAASPAFVHFATSGLEAPLTHLLLAAFYVGAVRGTSLRVLALLASGVALCRMDAVLFCVAPMLLRVHEDARKRGPLRAFGDAALGVLPFLAWSLFALVYYGSAVPNTAYAKLAHGTSRTEVIAQGVSYLWTTVTFDPPGTALAVLGMAAALRDGRRVMLACGVSVLLYVAYVVSVGGDFMAGRFTTPVLVAGAVLWLVSTWGDEHLELATRTTRRRAALVGLIAVLGVLPHDHVATPLARSLGLPIPAGPLPLHSTHWVTVEQAFYWRATALLEVARSSSPPPRHEWADRGRSMGAEGGVHLARNIGFAGFAAAGGATLVDPYALSDAFLARLPAARNIDWHVGHYRRAIPYGYPQSVADGRCHMDDPELCELFDLVRSVTHGPVFAEGRLDDILRLHRFRPSPRLTERMVHGDLVQSVEQPPEPIRFLDSGLDVRFEAPLTQRWVARVSPCREYEAQLFRGDQRVLVERAVAQRASDGAAGCVLTVPIRSGAVSRVRILPLERPGPYHYLGVVSP